jgi:hypothetical protein
VVYNNALFSCEGTVTIYSTDFAYVPTNHSLSALQNLTSSMVAVASSTAHIPGYTNTGFQLSTNTLPAGSAVYPISVLLFNFVTFFFEY